MHYLNVIGVVELNCFSKNCFVCLILIFIPPTFKENANFFMIKVIFQSNFGDQNVTVPIRLP